MSIYTLGIDIGSTASKCVILADGKEIISKSLIAVGAGTSGPQRAISQVLENAGMKEEDMAFTLATGYGRNSLEGIADYQMSELSCHAKGASFLFPDVHTVIDIGGQDVKVLQIENGVMTNFVMNDKCAAGTGRFLDVMARVLEVKVEELGALGAQSTKNLAISSSKIRMICPKNGFGRLPASVCFAPSTTKTRSESCASVESLRRVKEMIFCPCCFACRTSFKTGSVSPLWLTANMIARSSASALCCAS